MISLQRTFAEPSSLYTLRMIWKRKTTPWLCRARYPTLLASLVALLLLLLHSFYVFEPALSVPVPVNTSARAPRIAIIFWGPARSVRKVAPSVRRVVTRLRALGNVTSFLHTYSAKRHITLRSGERAVGDYLGDYLRPDVVAVDDLDTTRVKLNLSSFHVPGRDPWKDDQAPWVAMDNFVLGLYSLRCAMKLAIEAGPFDRVVFMRPDSWYANADGIIACLAAAASGRVAMPREGRWGVMQLPELLRGTLNPKVNDQFAVAAWDDAVVMGLRFDGLRDFAARYMPHPEGFLAAVLNARGAVGVSCDFCMLRVRTDGACEKVDAIQCVEERERLAAAPDTASRAVGYISRKTANFCPEVAEEIRRPWHPFAIKAVRGCLEPQLHWRPTRIATGHIAGDPPLVVVPGVIASEACSPTGLRSDGGIVYATHMTMDRLPQLKLLASRWQGCVSVAIALCSAAEWQEIETAFAESASLRRYVTVTAVRWWRPGAIGNASEFVHISFPLSGHRPA